MQCLGASPCRCAHLLDQVLINKFLFGVQDIPGETSGSRWADSRMAASNVKMTTHTTRPVLQREGAEVGGGEGGAQGQMTKAAGKSGSEKWLIKR